MRLAALLAACALGLSACGQNADDDRPKTRISLKGERSEVTLGDEVTLTGRVRPRASEIVLVGAEGPTYAKKRHVATTRTDGRGGFRFVARPRRNTAYTVRAADGAESGNVVVYAGPRYEIDIGAVAPGRSQITFEVHHPADLVPTRRPVQFYAGRDRYVRVGESRLQRRGRTLAVARSPAFARPRTGAEGLACIEVPIAPGYGSPPVEGCGKRRLRIVK